MKTLIIIGAISLMSINLYAQSDSEKSKSKTLYMDVHKLEPGKVTFEAVQGAHAKDLAVQSKHGVAFTRFWVDEKQGLVYCLSSAPDTLAVRNTHEEAHGLVPATIYEVIAGTEAAPAGGKELFMDVHELGPGKVTAKDVEAAHQKDLAVKNKHGVRFINYWVNEKDGVIMCLSEAKDPEAVIQTHKEAHGLIPVSIHKVKQGQ
jgi:hypothetical protein